MISEKTLHNSDGDAVEKNVPDVKFFGNPNTFQLISKASSIEEGWMKSTKAMEIIGVGCVMQVTTQQLDENDNYTVAEALTFVPGVRIKSFYKLGGEVRSRKIIKADMYIEDTPEDRPIAKRGSERRRIDRRKTDARDCQRDDNETTTEQLIEAIKADMRIFKRRK